jgi:hypothetical protein
MLRLHQAQWAKLRLVSLLEYETAEEPERAAWQYMLPKELIFS